MKHYACKQCHMEVKPLICHKCNIELKHNLIDKQGQKIVVAQCPKCQGMIKSPQCCGLDMQEV